MFEFMAEDLALLFYGPNFDTDDYFFIISWPPFQLFFYPIFYMSLRIIFYGLCLMMLPDSVLPPFNLLFYNFT